MSDFGDFIAIFDFLSRGTFFLNYNCLSICAGCLIFMFCSVIHICYGLSKGSSIYYVIIFWEGGQRSKSEDDKFFMMTDGRGLPIFDDNVIYGSSLTWTLPEVPTYPTKKKISCSSKTCGVTTSFTPYKNASLGVKLTFYRHVSDYLL